MIDFSVSDKLICLACLLVYLQTPLKQNSNAGHSYDICVDFNS